MEIAKRKGIALLLSLSMCVGWTVNAQSAEVPYDQTAPEQIILLPPEEQLPDVSQNENNDIQQLAEANRQFGAHISLDGVSLSSYTYPIAYIVFNQRLQNIRQNFQVQVTIAGKDYFLHADDIDFQANTLDVLRQLWILGAVDGDIADDGVYATTYTYDTDKLNKFTENIANEVKAKSYTLDSDDLNKKVRAAVEDAIWKNQNHQAGVKITANPKVTKAPAPASSGGKTLGSYTTKTTANANRNTNIKLASQTLNGTVVKPGQIFSYNNSLGPASSANGYKVAAVFSGGKVSSGVGGGICQVSSTLYNAVLAAGLKVVERHPHSLPVTYVPKGKDATVSRGSLDFRFQNTTDKNITVAMSFDGRNLTVSLKN